MDRILRTALGLVLLALGFYFESWWGWSASPRWRQRPSAGAQRTGF